MKKTLAKILASASILLGAANADQVLPVVANTPGAQGSFWKNDTSVSNPTTEEVSGKLVFFKAGESGDDNLSPSIPISLGPNQTMCIENPLEQIGVEGFGAMKFVSDKNLVFTSRTYNKVGNEELGQGMRGVLDADFLKQGDSASFVTVKDNSLYRYNFGVYAEEASQIQFELYSNSGLLTSVVKDFPPRYLIQQDVKTFFGLDVPANTAILAKVLSGKALMYGSGVHNFTGDGGMQEQNVFQRVSNTNAPVDMDLCYLPEFTGQLIKDNADELGATLVGAKYYDSKKDPNHLTPIYPSASGWAKLLRELFDGTFDESTANYESKEVYVLDNFNNLIAFADPFNNYKGQDLEVLGLTEEQVDAFNNVLYSRMSTIPRSEDKTILPVVANTPGAQGSFWMTDLQLVNPYDTEISGKIMFFASGMSNPEDKEGLEFTLAPKQVMLYENFLSLIGVQGFGAAKVVMNSGKAPKISARTYNAINGKELSQGMNDFLLEELLVAGEKAYLLTVKDTNDFRFNIGVYAEDESLVDFKVEDENGNTVMEVQKYFPARYHTQASIDQFFSTYVPKNSKITASIVNGKVKVYGSGVHNATGDGYYQDAVVLDRESDSSAYVLNKVYPHDKVLSNGKKFHEMMYEHAREFAEVLGREHINMMICGDPSVWVHWDIETWEYAIQIYFDNNLDHNNECQHVTILRENNVFMLSDVFSGREYGENRCTLGTTASDISDIENILKKYL